MKKERECSAGLLDVLTAEPCDCADRRRGEVA